LSGALSNPYSHQDFFGGAEVDFSWDGFGSVGGKFLRESADRTFDFRETFVFFAGVEGVCFFFDGDAL
jgi:hypothetical protein